MIFFSFPAFVIYNCLALDCLYTLMTERSLNRGRNNQMETFNRIWIIDSPIFQWIFKKYLDMAFIFNFILFLMLQFVPWIQHTYYKIIHQLHCSSRFFSRWHTYTVDCRGHPDYGMAYVFWESSSLRKFYCSTPLARSRGVCA